MSVESMARERQKYYGRKRNLIERGREFIRLHKRSKGVCDEKKELGERLKASMLDAGVTEVNCGKSGRVVLETGKTKSVTLGDLMAILGDRGQEVWDSIKSKTYQYVTAAIPLLVIVPMTLLR